MTQGAVLDWQTRMRLMAATVAVQWRVAMLGRTVRLGPWIPLAQAEEPRGLRVGDVIGPVDGGEPLTSADLALVAKLYDARIHRAAILAQEGPDNPHAVAEGYPAAGWIEKVVATPTHLWGRVVEIIDEDGESRITKWLRAGYVRRSVCIQTNRQDVTGPYLRHLILASGFAEGQGGNPNLLWFFPDALKIEGPSAERLAVADSGGLRRISYEEVDPAARAATEESTMTPEEMLASVQQVFEGALTKLKDELTGQMAETAEAAKVAADAQAERLSALEASVATNRIAETERTYRLSLNTLKAEGRISTPEELEAELADLVELSPEKATARLARLATRQPIKPAVQILNLPEKLTLERATMPNRSRMSSAGLELLEELAPEKITMDTLRAMDRLEASRKEVAL